MTERNWRDTLYIWDGIVTLGKTDSDDGGDDDDGNDGIAPVVPLQWEGRWIPIKGVPDATKAEAPVRRASKKDIDADCQFVVAGTATPLSVSASEVSASSETVATSSSTEDDNNDNDNDNDNEKEQYEKFFVAKLTDGAGWEMKDDDDDDNDDAADTTDDATKGKTNYQDETHDVLVKTLRWSGNQRDQRDYLIVAKGKNEFGHFVSVGWMRPGCRWTLARRYLASSSDGDNNNDNNTDTDNNNNDDPRISWSLLELYNAMVNDSIEIEEGSDERTLKLPPWQSSVMHVNYQEGGPAAKRQKTSTD